MNTRTLQCQTSSMVCAAGRRKQSPGSRARGCAFKGVGVGQNFVSFGPLSSALCVFAVWKLPCQKAVVPSLVARAEVRVVHRVVVADALACAWGRQRGHPVEVAAFFNREVPSPEPSGGQRGILLLELYSLHFLNLKGPSFCRHSSYWSSSSRPGASPRSGQPGHTRSMSLNWWFSTVWPCQDLTTNTCLQVARL